jgi:hypothetical protein
MVLAFFVAPSSAQIRRFDRCFAEGMDWEKFCRSGGGGFPSEGIKTWSLFLPCNPLWLVPEKQHALHALHQLYVAFGETTGPRHAAVWFFKGGNPDNLDVRHSSVFCQRFGLRPSEGPFIVVTTVSPDQWAQESKLVLAFANRPASTISEMIGRLTDQVAAERLSQDEIDSAQYWRTWIRVIEGTCRYLSKVKFIVSVKGALSLERTGLCGDTTS